MNKIAEYLAGHLGGEVSAEPQTRAYFSHDASILQKTPNVIVYPRTSADVRKVARFTWQLAEKGHTLAITARGSGTDITGAAIGNGIVMVFLAHMARILELDTRSKMIRVQPGLNFKALSEAIATHGLFLPPFPASYKFSTIGGAIANNTSGEKSIKYGSMVDWVDRVEVVLANGEIIQTGRINRRELSAKKGLQTMEGEIYRAIDGLIEDNTALIKAFGAEGGAGGYAIDKVKRDDGTFDLTPLFVGSQGTLGIISQAIIKIAPRTPSPDIAAVAIDAAHADKLGELTRRLRDLKPSALEFIDGGAVEMAERLASRAPYRKITDAVPAAIIIAEFDDVSDSRRNKSVRTAAKIMDEYGTSKLAASWEDQEEIWSIRHATAAISGAEIDGRTALPVTTDARVPLDKLDNFLADMREVCAAQNVEIAMWGHIGVGNVNVQPFLDLSKTGDRQKVFKIMKEYFELARSYGGVTTGENGDGRLRVPFASVENGSEVVELFARIKDIFDPHGTLNPGVKIDTSLRDVVMALRKEYNLTKYSDIAPRM